MALVYGDDPNHGPANPKTTNHWGQAYKNYDESGLDTILEYDFKGNVLSGKKQVIKDSLLIDAINAGAANNWEVAPYRVDWTTSPWNEETNLLEGNYETDNVFDALNRPTETTYPADINHVRKVASTTYNRAGALQKLKYDGVDYIEHIAYDAKGGVIMTAYGNGIMTRSLYDRITFRLKRVRTSAFTRSGWTFTDNAGVKEDKVFTYDLQGNIVSTHDKCTDCGLPSSPDDLTRSFTYDSIYRLLTATGRESNTQPSSDVWNDAAPTPSPNAQNCRTYTQAFEYDKLGNILKKIHTATGNNFTRRYNYQTGTNKLLTIDNNQSTPTVIASFAYDVKGNQTLCQSEKHYEWDYADRMRAFYNQTGTGVEPTVYAVYLYDGGGNRTKKLVRKQGGTWESVTYVGGGFEYHKKGTEEKNYTQIANVEIRTGSFTGDGSETTLYQLKDHLGSVGLRLNHSGSTIDREEYYPFGDSSLRTFTKKRYRYCGKEKDEESGLYYYGARYYMSWAARFISIDPLAADYVHLTPYNYAGNKPITYYDIDGMQSSDDSDNSDKVYHAVGPEIEFKADGLGNAEQGFKDWFNNLGGFASLDSFRETLYQSKLSSFQSQIGKGGIGALMYGTDRYGITQIPNSIKQKFRQEAIEEAFPTLKEIWATQVSGYSSSTLNPLGRINYKAVRAGAVTSYSEGKSIVTSVAMETGLEWIMHAPSLSTSKNLVNLVRKTEARTVGVVEGQAVALADAELLPTVLRIEGAAAKGVPKPSPKFKTPTNAPQNPLVNVPEGYTQRIMKPTEQYPNGYWVLEKQQANGGWQKVNPSTMKPGQQHETHVPLPTGYWNK